MFFAQDPKMVHWTFHARAKMRFYRLSEQRVRQGLHAPQRVEEGVAPKTIAMMQPVSPTYRYVSETVPSGAQRSRGTSSHSSKLGKREETWRQEIWVMIQQTQNSKLKTKNVKIISAWRYPGRTKPRSPASLEAIKSAYHEYMSKEK